MKRLSLENFKAQQPAQKTDLLLNQVLGNCHEKPEDNCSDDTNNDNDSGGGGTILGDIWDAFTKGFNDGVGS